MKPQFYGMAHLIKKQKNLGKFTKKENNKRKTSKDSDFPDLTVKLS